MQKKTWHQLESEGGFYDNKGDYTQLSKRLILSLRSSNAQSAESTP